MCLDTNRHTTTHFYTLAAQVTSTLFERYKSKTTTWKAGLRFFPLKLPVQFRPIPFTEPVNGLFAVAAGCAICLPDHFWLTCWKKVGYVRGWRARSFSECSVLWSFSECSSNTHCSQVSVFTTWTGPLHNGDSWWVMSLIMFHVKSKPSPNVGRCRTLEELFQSGEMNCVTARHPKQVTGLKGKRIFLT